MNKQTKIIEKMKRNIKKKVINEELNKKNEEITQATLHHRKGEK